MHTAPGSIDDKPAAAIFCVRDDFVVGNHPVWMTYALIEELDLASPGLDGAMPSIRFAPRAAPLTMSTVT